jgi:SAM-dependent methyltransferase
MLTRIRRRLATAIAPQGGPPAGGPAKKISAAKRARGRMAGVNEYTFNLSEAQMDREVHRKRVGGMWDEIGKHQFDYLVEQGLKPGHEMLDVGCGALRGGIHFIRYLEPGNYYGVDVNESLLRAAFERELPAVGLTERARRDNFRVTSRFDVDFGTPFDYALAQSVFTHLPLNYIKLCLARVAQVMAPGGRFYATFCWVPDDLPYEADYKQSITTSHAERDVFHYRVHELEWAAQVADWETTYIGEWGHPRGQQMMLFRRPG